MTDNEKIAVLTTEAIKTLGETTSKQIMASITAAENSVRELRKEAELLIKETMTRTEGLAEKVNHFITACQGTTEDFKTRRERIGTEVAAGGRRGDLPVLIKESDLVGEK